MTTLFLLHTVITFSTNKGENHFENRKKDGETDENQVQGCDCVF